MKPDDYYVLFSPIKYWKSLGLGEKKFIEGYLFNRDHFHASPSAISCILWKNFPENREEILLKVFDIVKDVPIYLRNIFVRKAHKTFESYFDRRKFQDEDNGIFCEKDGNEAHRMTNGKSHYNKNIIGYMVPKGFVINQTNIDLVRTTFYNTRGFYLRSDNFIEKLPLFAAKLYPQKNWYERDIYFTTADGGERYLADKEFLKSCLVFTCLSQRNHCRSFDGSDRRFYRNELCFGQDTLADSTIKKYKLITIEKTLLETFTNILAKAKQTKNYNKKYTYGTYQIDEELNTRFKDENNEWIYDYPELNTAVNDLKAKLTKYYEEVIQPKLFEYELLK